MIDFGSIVDIEPWVSEQLVAAPLGKDVQGFAEVAGTTCCTYGNPFLSANLLLSF